MTVGGALYVDIDPHACEWMENLIKAGAIAPGVVWCRDLRSIEGFDLVGFTQVHLCAGIGVWSYALRLAGFPDDRPVWTWSEPCQPWSAAGKRKGFEDERYIRPDIHRLVRFCRPPIAFGEQVASKDGLAWLDVVQSDMEGEGYAFGAVDLCSAGVGAPHIRQRLHFVAELADSESERLLGRQDDEYGWRGQRAPGQGCEAGVLAHPGRAGGGRDAGAVLGAQGEGASERGRAGRVADKPFIAGADGILADADQPGLEILGEQSARDQCAPAERSGEAGRPGPVNGFWRASDWLHCTDGKWRPALASHVALAHGASSDLGRMRPNESANEEGAVNGNINQTNPREVLPPVRGIAAEEAYQRSAGRPGCVSSAKILRPDLHGGVDGRDNQSPERQELAPPICETGSAGLRGMRNDATQDARPSQRREPTEQLSVQLEDVVRLLPQSLSLAELHGDWRAAGELRSLLKAVDQARAVRNSSESLTEFWSSLSKEEKGWVGLGFDAARWKRVDGSPLVDGPAFRLGSGGPFEGKSRAAMLKGYGNAINSRVAAEFIRAYLDTEQGSGIDTENFDLGRPLKWEDL